MKPSRLRTVSVTDSWAALPDEPGENISILNKTGADLEIRHSGQQNAGEQITIADGQSVGLTIAANAKEIEIQATSGAAGVQLVID